MKIKIDEYYNNEESYEWSHGVFGGPLKEALDKMFDTFHSELVPKALSESTLTLVMGAQGPEIQFSSLDTGLIEVFLGHVDLSTIAQEEIDRAVEFNFYGEEESKQVLRSLRDSFSDMAKMFDEALTSIEK